MPAPHDPISAAFGAALREVRSSRGVSQDVLARRAHVQRTYVVDVEQGRRNLTLRNIVRLARALEVSLAELMGKVDSRF